MKGLTTYDTFLSHSHLDAEIVELIAKKLEDNHQLKIWLDKWILIPGEPFIQAMSKGLEQAKTCIIIIGSTTPKGWFEEEVGKALNKQTKNKSFRVIQLLLPNTNESYINDFLELRTWVRFKQSIEEPHAFHELVCGIKGIPPGRFNNELKNNSANTQLKNKLKQIKELYDENLIDESVKIEFQKMFINDALK